MSRAPLADHRQSEQEEAHQPRAQVRRDEDYQLLLASRLGDNGVEQPQGACRHGQAEAQKGEPSAWCCTVRSAPRTPKVM